MEQKWTKEELRAKLGGKFFTAEFVKKDGSIRKMNCQLVKKDRYFAGGELKGDRSHLLEVIDTDIRKENPDDPKKAWRSINLTTLISFKALGDDLA